MGTGCHATRAIDGAEAAVPPPQMHCHAHFLRATSDPTPCLGIYRTHFFPLYEFPYLTPNIQRLLCLPRPSVRDVGLKPTQRIIPIDFQ
jgi:hypothetical protein